MNVCGVTFGGYLAKILSFKTGNLLKLNASAMTFCRPFCIGDLLVSKKGCQPNGGQN